MEAYNSLVAASSTYELSGRILTLVALIHKNPNEMAGSPLTYTSEAGVLAHPIVVTRNAVTPETTPFVERDVAPGDLVAILQTSGGAGTLQQFTNTEDLDASLRRDQPGFRRPDYLRHDSAIEITIAPAIMSHRLT